MALSMTRAKLAVALTLAGSFLLPAGVWASRPGDSVGRAEVDNVVRDDGRTLVKSVRGGYIHSVSLICTTAPCEVAVYDSTSSVSGAGTLKWEGRISANNGSFSESFFTPLVTENGIAVEVTGTGGSAFIGFE